MVSASMSSRTRSLARFPGHIGVTSDPSILASFASDQSGRAGARPIAIAHPTSTEEIQAVVRWAIAQGVPLVPVSSKSGPRRRGDTVCDHPSIIMDLSGMNKVVHVDGDDAIAVIEPGVTFSQFDAALKGHGLRSFRPLAPRASKSVLTAFLEREPVTVPGQHWDSADPLAALELVFGSGDLFRTGGAALPGTLEENLARGNRQMINSGPMHTDFGRVIQGAQGALGVVSWASIYCQRIPAIEVPLFATSDSLEAITDLCYRMLRRRSAGQLFILNGRQLALLLADSLQRFEALKAALPPWILYVELSAAAYFPEEAIAYRRADLERDAASLAVTVASDVAGISAKAMAQWMTAESGPGEAALGLARQEVFFLSQLDKVQKHIDALEPTDRADSCIYVQPLAQGVNAHCQFAFLGKAGEEQMLSRRAVKAAERLAASNGFFSRPYHPWAGVPFERDKAIVPLLARTKSLFDPHAILQPGAQSLGIRQ